jgi:hypothetical protein
MGFGQQRKMKREIVSGACRVSLGESLTHCCHDIGRRPQFSEGTPVKQFCPGMEKR